MIAQLGHRCAVDRLRSVPGRSLSGDGWVAVRTGAASNDLNGVVSDGMVAPRDLERLVGWLRGVPASWLTTRADPRLTDALVAHDAVPERTGHWCGRTLPLDATGADGVRCARGAAPILDVLDRCGWYTDAEDRAVRTPLLEHALADGRWSHWSRSVGEEPVAALTARTTSTTLEIVDVAVVPGQRRQGLATALVEAATAWGAAAGAEHVVAAPSPDGAGLFASLGFAFEAVEPDVCFYLDPGAV